MALDPKLIKVWKKNISSLRGLDGNRRNVGKNQARNKFKNALNWIMLLQFVQKFTKLDLINKC